MSGTPPTVEPAHHFIQIDEEGFLKMDDVRVSDIEIGRQWLSQLRIDERGRTIAQIGLGSAIVECFDEPYIALDIERSSTDRTKWQITVPYDHIESIHLESLTVDEWDRFHGRTDRGIPFVLSRGAQARFFNLLDEFDDDSITVDLVRHEMKPWLKENPDVNKPEFWSNIYRTETPRWDLGAPSQALPSLVPKLKLSRSRVLVLGSGPGNDAAWFASQGHIVTAVDFSAEAIQEAKNRYGHLANLSFVQADVFALPTYMHNAFDIVFEHTCYCAIDPGRRSELVRVWRQVLVDNGHLMGVFFAFDKPSGPPYGGSEWELRARLQKNFRALYWQRLRDSIEKRIGHEFFVYSQKRPAL